MNFRLVKMSQNFPFINELSEIKSTYFDSTKALERLPQRSPFGRIYFKALDRYILGDMCIDSPSGTWNFDDVAIVRCRHSSWSDRYGLYSCIIYCIQMLPHSKCRSMWCKLVQDMVRFATLLQETLRETNELMRLLRPTLKLVGSIAEGTRIGFSNELDIMVCFDGWEEHPPFMVDADTAPLLGKSNSCPCWMDRYFDEQASFRYHLFKQHFLEAVDSAVRIIYECSKAPKRLVCVSTNSEFSNKFKSCPGCKENLTQNGLFIQCRDCIVTTSQTKMGACLQFEWKVDSDPDDLLWGKRTPFYKLYCSMDLVPIMTIESRETSELQGLVNKGMLFKEDPTSWFKQLRNLAKEDRLIEGLADQRVNRVLLKTSSCKLRNNYFIRAGQLLGKDTFKCEKLRKAYCYIKALKKAFAIGDISMFRVKKMFHLPLYMEIGEKLDNIHDVVHDVLMTSEFRTKFEDHIDFENWREAQDYIPLVVKQGLLNTWIQAFIARINMDALSVPTFSLLSSDIFSIVIPAMMLMTILASREVLAKYHFFLDLIFLSYIKLLSLNANQAGPTLLTMYMACKIVKVGISLVGFGTPYQMSDEYFLTFLMFFVSSIAIAGLGWYASICMHNFVRRRLPSFEKLFIKVLDLILFVLIVCGLFLS